MNSYWGCGQVFHCKNNNKIDVYGSKHVAMIIMR